MNYCYYFSNYSVLYYTVLKGHSIRKFENHWIRRCAIVRRDVSLGLGSEVPEDLSIGCGALTATETLIRTTAINVQLVQMLRGRG